MAEYKRTKHGILNSNNTLISENGYGWDKYEKWIADGGVPDELMTIEAICNIVISEIENEFELRGNSKIKNLQAIKRKITGTETLDDIDKMAKIDTLEAACDRLKVWAEDPLRTREELETFDVKKADWS